MEYPKIVKVTREWLRKNWKDLEYYGDYHDNSFCYENVHEAMQGKFILYTCGEPVR